MLDTALVPRQPRKVEYLAIADRMTLLENYLQGIKAAKREMKKKLQHQEIAHGEDQKDLEALKLSAKIETKLLSIHNEQLHPGCKIPKSELSPIKEYTSPEVYHLNQQKPLVFEMDYRLLLLGLCKRSIALIEGLNAPASGTLFPDSQDTSKNDFPTTLLSMCSRISHCRDLLNNYHTLYPSPRNLEHTDTL